MKDKIKIIILILIHIISLIIVIGSFVELSSINYKSDITSNYIISFVAFVIYILIWIIMSKKYGEVLKNKYYILLISYFAIGRILGPSWCNNDFKNEDYILLVLITVIVPFINLLSIKNNKIIINKKIKIITIIIAIFIFFTSLLYPTTLNRVLSIYFNSNRGIKSNLVYNLYIENYNKNTNIFNKRNYFYKYTDEEKTKTSTPYSLTFKFISEKNNDIIIENYILTPIFIGSNFKNVIIENCNGGAFYSKITTIDELNVNCASIKKLFYGELTVGKINFQKYSIDFSELSNDKHVVLLYDKIYESKYQKIFIEKNKKISNLKVNNLIVKVFDKNKRIKTENEEFSVNDNIILYDDNNVEVANLIVNFNN